MTAKEDIFLLIKSLTPSECRYFKLFTQSTSNSKNNLLLFDFIKSQDVYNEAEIKKHFKGQQFIVNFSVAKRFLYESLIEALKNYKNDISPRHILRSLMDTIAVLLDKDLVEQAYFELTKAKRIAGKNEFFDELLTLNRLEYNLISKLLKQRDDSKIQAINREFDDLTKKQTELLEIGSLHRKSFELLKNPQQNAEKQLSENNKFFTRDYKFNSSLAHIKFLQIKSLIYIKQGNYAEHYNCEYQILKLYETLYKKGLLEEPEKYLNCIHNYLIASINTAEFVNYNTYLEVYFEFFKKKELKLHAFRAKQYLFYDKLLWLLKTRKFKEACEFIEKENMLTFLKNQNLKERYVEALYCMIFNAYYFYADLRNARKALFYLTNKKITIIPGLHSLRFLFDMLISYSSKEYLATLDSLQYLKRKISKLDNVSLELLVANWVANRIKIDTDLITNSSLLYQDLQKLKLNPIEAIKFEYFDFEQFCNKNK